MTETNADPEQIEEELARTRARIDHRLSDLEERLSPSQLLNDGLATISGGDGAEFTRDMLARARANPLPVLLTGLGIGWWVLSEKEKATAKPLANDPHVVQELGSGVRVSAFKSQPSAREKSSGTLALGAIGAAVGAALALTFPVTRYEQGAVGNIRI